MRALVVDRDDVFFAGSDANVYEKVGSDAIEKLGPAGGPVTAMAIDATYLYWAIAVAERDPAIYRAKRTRPESELVAKIGAVRQLVIAGDYVYWLDTADGAIRRLRRPK